jgi:hypothetical protein
MDLILKFYSEELQLLRLTTKALSNVQTNRNFYLFLAQAYYKRYPEKIIEAQSHYHKFVYAKTRACIYLFIYSLISGLFATLSEAQHCTASNERTVNE